MGLKEFIIAVVVLLSCSCAAADGRIKIGVSTALTGPAATFGTDIKNAVMFANEHLAGGRYEIVVEDDQCSARMAVQIAKKFTQVDGIQYVFGNCSATVISTAPIYRNAGTYLFAPLATSRRLSTCGSNVIRMAPNDAASAKALYDAIAARQRSLGILTEISDYSVDLASVLEEKGHGGGLRIANEEFTTGTVDFRSLLMRLKHRGIDSLFINSNTEEAFAEILDQVRELDIDVPLYGAFIPGSSGFLKKSGAKTEGIRFIDFPANQEYLTEEGRRWYKLFTSEYGPPLSWEIGFALTFEAFRLLDSAIRANEDVASFAKGKPLSGIFGPFLLNGDGSIEGIKPVLRAIEGNGSVRTLAWDEPALK